MNLASIADHEGRFAEGYTDDMINTTFGELQAAAGVTLICIWEYFDAWGYGGSSDFYILVNDIPHELAGTLRSWLAYNPAAGEDRMPLSEPETWAGAAQPDYTNWADLPGDGWHNYALENRE
ncbi:hypothetical protein [Gordonia sihwensis]|uniref:hypothetical protein n=1 Tax=Gordonia sihwensis TaxID=173559 RepID=UPI003D9689E4